MGDYPIILVAQCNHWGSFKREVGLASIVCARENGGRLEDAMLLSLKMGYGDLNQDMQVVSRSWAKQGSECSPRAPRSNQPC